MNLRAFEEKLGYNFENPKLLETALTHRSFAYEKGGLHPDNQRLEFLGDAVLGFVIADIMFQLHPDAQEGTLTKIRCRLVCENTLFILAQNLDLGSFLKLGKGEITSGSAKRPGPLADAYEAIIGAIFLDGGMDKARAFIKNHFKPYIDNPNGNWLPRDAKSRLQEITQKQKKSLQYQTISQIGPEHAPTFEIAVCIDNQIIAKACGKSKRDAEQAAAENALNILCETQK